jgi:hypothetical protein
MMVINIAKRLPDNTYRRENNVLPLQLTWIYSEVNEDQKPTITSPGYCDFGYLDEREQRFILSTYVQPANYPGWISRNESMRVEVMAEAKNGESKKLVVEVTWDGRWQDGTDVHDDLQRHLVVKKPPPYDYKAGCPVQAPLGRGFDVYPSRTARLLIRFQAQ